MSLDGSQTADTVAYIKSVGLSGLMSSVYNAFMDQAGVASNAKARSFYVNCYPYAKLGDGLKYGIGLATVAAYYAPPQYKGIFILFGAGLTLASAALSNYNSC